MTPPKVARNESDAGWLDEPLIMNMLRRFHGSTQMLVGFVVLIALFVAGCSSSASTHSANTATTGDGTSVSLKSLMFMPEVLTVKVGTKVTWRNDEPITHTVTSGAVTGVDASTGLRSGQKASGLFNATLKGKGDTFSYTFTKAGTYSYYCNIHHGMSAKVVVTR